MKQYVDTYALFHESGLICEHCGESSPNEYVHSLNHSSVVGLDACTSQLLKARHTEVTIQTGTR